MSDFESSAGDDSTTVGKLKRKKKPYVVPKGQALELPPCRVCGGKASGIHYGVNSCEACKGFFRRYLLRKEPYICASSGNCEILDQNRGNCSACRMKKCLDLGMSKEGVRCPPVIKIEDEQRPKASMETLNELQGSNAKVDFISIAVFEKLMVNSTPVNSPMNDSSASSAQGTEAGIGSHITASEGRNLFSPLSGFGSDADSVIIKSEPLDFREDTVNELIEAYLDIRPHSKLTSEEIAAKLQEGYEQYQLRSQMIGPLNALSPEEYNSVYQSTNIDVDGRKSIMDACGEMMVDIIRKYVSFSHKIPGFANLPAKDQANLLKASRFEFFMLLEYRFVDPDLEMMMIFTGHVLHLNEAGMWGTQDLMKSWQDFTRLLVKLELTNEEVAVMMAISMTFTDRCKLQDPERVEKIQLNLVDILHNLLKQHHKSKGTVWFSRIMDVFTTFRSFTEEFYNVYRNMCNDKFLQKHIPEMLEFMFDE
ncbi:hypothetical protein FSP39_001751 [Pinctada imbricata]|uniref:Uncharacterized protein n=1 Tax=Pinctada imbricata TaxID=66713 RepID=A0AA89C0F4_PINIB|nr:hypothetical protein FSP39_001751 [Pinctada imbricata]